MYLLVGECNSSRGVIMVLARRKVGVQTASTSASETTGRPRRRSSIRTPPDSPDITIQPQEMLFYFSSNDIRQLLVARSKPCGGLVVGVIPPELYLSCIGAGWRKV